MSFKDNDEEHVMHSKSDNIEIMISDIADEVIEEHLQSLLSRYQVGLETSSMVITYRSSWLERNNEPYQWKS